MHHLPQLILTFVWHTIMYMTVPVTAATAERSFSKLKVIAKLSSEFHVPRETWRFGSAIDKK